ncbi:hypothetical protein Tco_1064066 [Tanacetum coccineum]
MARQYTLPKRPRNAAWFKKKAMLAEAQEAGQTLGEEQLAFLADPSISDDKAVQTTIPNTASFQTKDLDAYDSNCDDVSNAKAVLMANLSNYVSDIISEVPHHEPYHTDMDNQSVHTMQELSNEQAFWLQTSYPKTDQSASSLVKIEAPWEIPKEHIKSMRENNKEEKVKHEMHEIETINIELEHSVAKLLYENEHLHKEIKHMNFFYKDQFDSIKKTRALSKERCDSFVAQLNSKSLENTNLKGQILEKVFVTTALQSELRKLKGKHVLDKATTIAPGIFKLDIEPLSHILKNNKDAHEDYLKKTIENTDTIHGLVERARKQNPSKLLLDSACKFTKHVQELLDYVSQTCPSFTKPSEKLVAVTPRNKVKKD